MLNSESVRLVYDASQRGRYVMFAHLDSASETDSELIAALEAAHDLGVEIKGFVPFWAERRLLEAISRRI